MIYDTNFVQIIIPPDQIDELLEFYNERLEQLDSARETILETIKQLKKDDTSKDSR